MIGLNITGEVQIVFPALADLVQFLRERVSEQKKIDQLAAQVAELTAGLQQSSAGLQEAVNKDTT